MRPMPEKIDSKFRFVLVAANRAEQLLRGAAARIETTGKKPTRVAQEEIYRDSVHWDYGPPPSEEAEVEEALEAMEEIH